MTRFPVSKFFSILCISVFVIGIYVYIYLLPENKCQMTYMFQNPEYLEISLPRDVKKEFPRYGLFVYGEGDYAERLKRGQFRGIPVLFIPGNAGSHRQVRSLASVSMRKTEQSKTANPAEFDYFSIDFDEELSGLYGGYLQRHTEFAAKCVARILSIYEKDGKTPRTLIIIGHSMGGSVARGLFLLNDFPSSLVHVVITLATAHSSPVAMFDVNFDSYYAQIRNYWSTNVFSTLKNVTVLSIGGGVRDIMVRSDLTLFERSPESPIIYNNGNVSGLAVFETTSSSIPLVWASTDHLCIVWCKQLVLAIVRSLFDMTSKDQNSKPVWSSDVSVHRKALRYHFFDRYDWKSNAVAKKAYEEMSEEENRIATEVLYKLASVARSYLQFMPAMCVWFICVMLIFDDQWQQNTFIGGRVNNIFRWCWILISIILLLQKTWRNDGISTLVATMMSYGIFSVTNVVATLISFPVRLLRRCSSRSVEADGISRRDCIRLSITLITVIATSYYYNLAIIALYLLVFSTMISEAYYLGSGGKVPEKKSILILQTHLVLICLSSPWAVVSAKNYLNGGACLPNDPMFIPVILWLCGEVVSMLYSQYQFRLATVAMVVGLVTIANCDRLYFTTYCCSILSGFYSRAYTRASSSSLSKVD